MSTSIYGIPIDSLSQNHRLYLDSLFNKPKTTSRLKELQSAISFFNQYNIGPDVGKAWRNKYARDINISVIINLLKVIQPITHLKVHRVCKTSYPLYVFISKHYQQLQPYLESFISVETKSDYVENCLHSNPFKAAIEMVRRNGYDVDTVTEACHLVGRQLSSFSDKPVETVTAVRMPSGEPIFVGYSKTSFVISSLDPRFAVHSEVVSAPQSPIPEAKIDELPRCLDIFFLLNHK
ncbi:hypothetical protein TVAG_293750 [Trichomonas vaginalis G3]|uniref:Uncharacterized protein n=1 Tax=Trichomonas vaginalis (strain ATCC PRA-98 / G3) TaxID=412133 RepID=A2FKA5_TRIV3|nr:hypothetical protein TVAGG3_0619840 [Trichomonas vaginalis G3]EAX94645.1 hypothetical protein TVAG_293750 [Trichomonas vaginalis G3]KAI5503820.1 hypothetical protein TVAGG3_0619840 [Trichomonas vaginalis G3]|eukprot:XP_001307575.1 hypothetical protein [Trichomonas vaginalis G3]